MIFDSIHNAHIYDSIHPLFSKVFDIIRSTDFLAAEATTVVVEQDVLFYNIMDATLSNAEEIELEAHRKYIDIQIPVGGKEVFGWKPVVECEHITNPYNEKEDILFFGDSPNNYISVLPNQFLGLFPGDAHAPCIGNGCIRKVVFKIRVK